MHFKNYYLKLGAFILCLYLFRVCYTQTGFYGFILFNIFLAGVPYCISSFLDQHKNISNTWLICLSIIWLLFLPNAPYLLTDIFHLKKVDNMPLYFDLVFLLMAAFLGLAFYFNSIIQIHNCYIFYFKKLPVKLFMGIIIVLSSMGIYFGRYARLNSWEAITNFKNSAAIILHAFTTPKFYGVTILFSVALYLLYEYVNCLVLMKQLSIEEISDNI